MKKRDGMLNIRVSREDKAIYDRAARRLRVPLTRLVLSTLDVVSRRVISDGWEARVVHLDGLRIVGIGEDPVMTKDGLRLPLASYTIVAPRRFWGALELAMEAAQP